MSAFDNQIDQDLFFNTLIELTFSGMLDIDWDDKSNKPVFQISEMGQAIMNLEKKEDDGQLLDLGSELLRDALLSIEENRENPDEDEL